jgi:hypothetical protein
MIRMALFTLAGIALVGPRLGRKARPRRGPTRRYTFHRVDDGYVRLDGRTGQVSMCAQRSVGGRVRRYRTSGLPWRRKSRVFRGESAAPQERAHRTQSAALPGAVKPEAPASGRRRARLATAQRMPIWIRSSTSLRKLWRRFVEVIVTLQKDMQNKT